MRWSYGVHLLAQADEEELLPTVVIDDPEAHLSHEPAPSSGATPDLFENSATSNRKQSRNMHPVTFDDSDHADTLNSSASSSVTSLHRQLLMVPDVNVITNSPRPSVGRQATHPHTFYSFPNTPARSTVHLPETPSTDPSTEDEETVQGDNDEWGVRSGVARVPTAPTRSKIQSMLRRTNRRVVKFAKHVNQFMTIPVSLFTLFI